MTPAIAREIVKELGIKQVDIADEMSQLGDANYTPQLVNSWLREGGRGPSVAFVIYLRMKQQIAALEAGA